LVDVKEAAVEHLRWFGKKTGRLLLRKAVKILADNPLAESKQMKTLPPNRVAQKELRVWGKYRVLFSVNDQSGSSPSFSWGKSGETSCW
jgi:mRNA-degrading endonuclease RelE of RelBE toxin-antitoxin system